jgi:hypothetical protein
LITTHVYITPSHTHTHTDYPPELIQEMLEVQASPVYQEQFLGLLEPEPESIGRVRPGSA